MKTDFLINYFEINHEGELYCMDNIQIEVYDYTKDYGLEFGIKNVDMCGEVIPEAVIEKLNESDELYEQVEDLYLSECKAWNDEIKLDRYLEKRRGIF